MRRLRKSAAALCMMVSVALGLLWFRSYQSADQVFGPIANQHSFLVGAKQGRLVGVVFRWQPQTRAGNTGFLLLELAMAARDERGSRWRNVSYPAKDEMSFPVGDARQYDAALGFGVLREPAYMVTRSTFETPAGGTIYISGAASASLDGWGVSVPFWFLVLATAAAAVALSRERPWRFGLRGFFAAVTIVALVLGLVAAFDKPPKNWELDQPVPLDGI